MVGMLAKALTALLASCHLANAAPPFFRGPYPAVERASPGQFGFARSLTLDLEPRNSGNNSLQGDGPLQWDSKSAFINGQRVFIYSEEYHPFRYPSKVWRDSLQKIKSAGFNTVSIYTHWGLISASAQAARLDSFNNLAEFLQVAKEVGVWIILRPGPYINAETTNGGIAPWLQNLPGPLRENSTTYIGGQGPYLTAISNAAKPYQVRKGSDGKLDPSSGPILLVQIENEYTTTPERAAYFEILKKFYRDHGITVPFSFNNVAVAKTAQDANYAQNVELYGEDNYPVGFDCKAPDDWGSGAPTLLWDSLQAVKPSQVKFVPEYQGGSFDPFGGYGYDQCLKLVNVNFARVYGQSLLGQGIRMESIYMGAGGTNWGGLAYPGVYTSYDYAAGISENRIIRSKHREYALTGGFWQAFPAFIGANRAYAGTGGDVVQSSKPIYSVRYNAEDDSKQVFYVARQNDSTSFDTATFKLNVSTIRGARTVPVRETFTLNGRDSRLIAINGALTQATLLYSTAQVSFSKLISGCNVVVLHSDAGLGQEAVFASSGASDKFSVQLFGANSSSVATNTSTAGEVRLNWKASNGSISYAILTAGNTKITAVLAETLAAYNTYATPIGTPGTLDYNAGLGELVLTTGIYLVRNATRSGNVLKLQGATNQTINVEIFTQSSVDTVFFNDKQLSVSKTAYGALKATVSGPSTNWTLPTLDSWKYADSLPEIQSGFDDSQWTNADKTSIGNEYFKDPVVQTDGRVLFGDAYGYHANTLVWRGKFDSAGNTSGIYLRFEGGHFSAGSLWLNNVFLGSLNANATYADDFKNFTFPPGALKPKGNVLTFLHDNSGLEEDQTATPVPIGFRKAGALDFNSSLPLQALKMPRGIIAYKWLGSSNATINWKVQGNYKGEQAPDKTRTYINEGGLYGEVKGWHLPGFDDSKWNSSTPYKGLQGPGVAFYRTSFTLDLPKDADIPLSLVYSLDNGTDYRSTFWINGWSFGKRVTKWGPQIAFPLHPGIVNPHGKNTLAVSLWNTVDQPAAIGSLKLVAEGIYTGAVEYTLNNPGYSELRG